jgi:hypothetical protein
MLYAENMTHYINCSFSTSCSFHCLTWIASCNGLNFIIHYDFWMCFFFFFFGYLSSLQGPLVRKSSIKWMVTSAVEYFHLFPYAGIVSTWFSRCTYVFSHKLPSVWVIIWTTMFLSAWSSVYFLVKVLSVGCGFARVQTHLNTWCQDSVL